MADPLYDLLAPYLDNEANRPSPRDPQTVSYLSRLSTLSFADLNTSEQVSLLHVAQSHLRNLQSLSKRSYKAVISSSSHLAHLSSLLPNFGLQARELNEHLPALENAAHEFAQKYDRNTESAVLDRRKQAALLLRNVDRVSDILNLPSLLSSTVASAQGSSAGSSSTTGATVSYTSALDLHAHVKRLKSLYPQSQLVANILAQSAQEMQNLAEILIASLQSPALKLAAAMRTIGWLRRVAPDLVEDTISMSYALSTNSTNPSMTTVSDDGALGSLFLVCRLRVLHETLDALDPLRDLADQETTQRERSVNETSAKTISVNSGFTGTQSERYLKRYIEIFREQSFSILSMYKSIFPSGLPQPEQGTLINEVPEARLSDGLLLPLPSPVSTFALHLVDMLESTLRTYMPNVTDQSSRESLLTQVLYCAGSLGRLGADFSMMVSLLEDDLAGGGESGRQADPEESSAEPEWVQIMKKHRIQASRLEVLARGVGTTGKGSMDVVSPSANSPSPLMAA